MGSTPIGPTCTRGAPELDIETKLELIRRPPTEEVITIGECRELLETKATPRAYDGFEPSGIPHLGTSLMKAQKTKDLTDAGIETVIFLATWHARLNNKFGGDQTQIRLAAENLVETWKALMLAEGVNMSLVKFVFADDIYNGSDYWEKVLRVGGRMSFQRALRSLTIAGRKSGDLLNLSTYFYIPMQVADIFQMGVDVCQLGMDQRKANILAREIGPSAGFWKPVCVHHHLITGLQGPKRMGFEEDEALDFQVSSKMSKRNPETSILATDAPGVIRTKLEGAFCPPKVLAGNPVIDICRNIILRRDGNSLEIERPIRFGGPLTFWNETDLEQAFRGGLLHPLDLKEAVATKLANLLEPVRRASITTALHPVEENLGKRN